MIDLGANCNCQRVPGIRGLFQRWAKWSLRLNLSWSRLRNEESPEREKREI